MISKYKYNLILYYVYSQLVIKLEIRKLAHWQYHPKNNIIQACLEPLKRVIFCALLHANCGVKPKLARNTSLHWTRRSTGSPLTRIWSGLNPSAARLAVH
jgi:hypothetical protein